MSVSDVSIEGRHSCNTVLSSIIPDLSHSQYVNLVDAISKGFVNVYFDIHNCERLNLLQNTTFAMNAKHSRLLTAACSFIEAH